MLIWQKPGKDLALFLDAGDMTKRDYLIPKTFESMPLVNILVSKTTFSEN